MIKRYLLLFAVVALPAFAFGQKVEITKDYKYTGSNDDSKNSARAKAMEEAQAALLQELGVLVEARQKMTTTASGNNKREDFVEELKTYTIGKVQTIVVAGTERFTDNDKGDMVYSATFKMAVDTSDLYKYLDNIVRQKEQARLAEIQKEQKILRLKKEIEEIKKQVEIAKIKENESLKTKNMAEKRLAELKAQKEMAERDYKNMLNSQDANTPAGMSKMKNAMNYLTETQNLYNAQEAEYKKLEKALTEAKSSVNVAQDNLYNVETVLAKETGTPLPIKQNNTNTLPTSPIYTEKPKTVIDQYRMYDYVTHPCFKYDSIMQALVFLDAKYKETPKWLELLLKWIVFKYKQEKKIGAGDIKILSMPFISKVVYKGDGDYYFDDNWYKYNDASKCILEILPIGGNYKREAYSPNSYWSGGYVEGVNNARIYSDGNNRKMPPMSHINKYTSILLDHPEEFYNSLPDCIKKLQ